MTLLRAAARTMLASFYVLNGVKTVRDPHPLVPATQPITDTVVPTVKKFAPEQVAGFVPTDTTTWVRIGGIAQIIGGLGVATGKGRRLGALILAGSIVPDTLTNNAFWSEDDEEEKDRKKDGFIKNIALIGSVLLVSQDTEGKPSLAWRAQAGTQRGSRAVSRGSRRAAKEAKQLARAAKREAQLQAKNAQLKLS
ncbi:DoxX family protein [Propionibacteriaceae bacterium Y1685]|uniref:DoxX family protein n=1 Tax=Microlunatus sp. Y1700 TaxID=3418487 RepID=UPI003B819AE9